MLGVQTSGLVQVSDCLGIPAQLDAGCPSLKVRLGVFRFNLNGPVEIPNHLFVPLMAIQAYPRVQVSRDIAGPEGDGPAEVPDPCLIFRLVQMGSAPAQQGVGVVRVYDATLVPLRRS